MHCPSNIDRRAHNKPRQRMRIRYTSRLRVTRTHEAAMSAINCAGGEDGAESADTSASMRLDKHSKPPERHSSLARLTTRASIWAGGRVWSTCLSTIVACIPALLVGYTIAFPSSAVLVLMDGWKEGRLPGKDYQFSTELSSVFGALAAVGAVFGGPVGGWISDHRGRKCGMMFSGVPYLLGYLLLSYAHYSPTATTFKTLLLFGRFFSGIGMGWACTTTSIYVGEIASAQLRGLFATVMQLFISIGVSLCYAISVTLPYYHVALAAVAITALFVLLGVWLEETPRWLLSHGQFQAAYGTLQWLRGPNYDTTTELQTIRSSLSEGENTTVWREFRKKSVLVPFITLLFVFFFQQIGGLNALGAYASVIFTYAGVSHPKLTAALSLGIGVVMGNIVSGFTVDKLGRKPLLVVSGIGMGIGSTLLGVHFYITRPSLCSDNGSSIQPTVDAGADDSNCKTQYGPLAIVSIVTFNFMFSIGWASVPWALLPELLTLKVRGVGGGFAILVNWATSALVIGAYLDFVQVATRWFAWWAFALLNFASVVFAIFFLVETKGKSLEMVQLEFKKRWKLKS